MKAILIDSTNKTVNDIEISKDNTLAQWYKVLGCDMVEIAAYINETDSILVDEEGLIKEMDDNSPFFLFDGAPQPYAGNGLITGVNEDGDSISPTVTAKDVRDKITFLTLRQTWLNNQKA